jgi:hypothetical protein
LAVVSVPIAAVSVVLVAVSTDAVSTTEVSVIMESLSPFLFLSDPQADIIITVMEINMMHVLFIRLFYIYNL